MAANPNVSNLAPRVQARISAWEKRAQAQRERLASLLSRQPSNASQSTRQQLFAQRLQQQIGAKVQWASAVKHHFDSLHEVLTRGSGGETASVSVAASNSRKTSSSGE
jgi:hypothetical protein